MERSLKVLAIQNIISILSNLNKQKQREDIIIDNKLKVLKEIRYNVKKTNRTVSHIFMINVWNLILIIALTVFTVIK